MVVEDPVLGHQERPSIALFVFEKNDVALVNKNNSRLNTVNVISNITFTLFTVGKLFTAKCALETRELRKYTSGASLEELILF